MNRITFFVLFIFFLFFLNVNAQVITEDYVRADTLLKRNNKVYNGAVRANWIAETSSFWYKNRERNGEVYYKVDASNGRKSKAFDHKKLANLLNKENNTSHTPGKLPLTDVKFHNVNELTFMADGTQWRYFIKNNRLEKDTVSVEANTVQRRWRGHKETTKVLSPDGKWEAFIRDNNIYVCPAGNEKECVALTVDGSPNLYYSSRIMWSPDSKKIATVKIRDVKERRIPLIESSPDKQLQPILQWRDYAKPGDVIPVHLPVLFDMELKKQIPLETGLYQHQFMLTLDEWRKDSSGFIFSFNQRGHQRYIVAEVNAETGNIMHLADEKSDTFIYYYKVYSHFLESGETLWVSERDGWRHIYLLSGETGEVKRQITKGEWVVRDILRVDEEHQLIYFTASGFNEGEDPYNLHYCTIRMDGSGFTDLTPENGNHTAMFSNDYAYFVDTYSRPDLPPVSILKKTSDASTVSVLEKCDISDLLAEGFTMRKVFQAKGRDAKTDIWGTITYPSYFDDSKSYPVIEMIYAGPHDSHVVKDFRAFNHLIDKTAELGFIVVSIDGMGTYNRSKAFHDVCWKNLKDAGFPDRILWMKAAAEKYPYMDISNVGIYGWSAGGQNAMSALLFHNDFYKVAVAFCGCHDNRMDKIWWNEQWMGYPLDESYIACSNVENAHLLKGKLFLINGELDDNVDPASTLQVVKALMDSGKNFDQLYLPARGHSLGAPFELRKMNDFFVKHIMKQDPPEW